MSLNQLQTTSNIDISKYSNLPECIRYSYVTQITSNYRDNRNGYESITPYDNDNWRAIAIKLNVVVPFDHIITKDQGHSVCRECDVRYVGYNPENCYQVVHKVKTGGSWSGSWVISEVCDKDPKGNRQEVCGGTCIWDQQKAFDHQRSFFSLIERLGCVHTDDLDTFASAFPVDKIDEIRTKYLAYQMLQFEVRVQNAFSQISSKMSQAGQALTFKGTKYWIN